MMNNCIYNAAFQLNNLRLLIDRRQWRLDRRGRVLSMGTMQGSRKQENEGD
jgi:hypothetical protein